MGFSHLKNKTLYRHRNKASTSKKSYCLVSSFSKDGIIFKPFGLVIYYLKIFEMLMYFFFLLWLSKEKFTGKSQKNCLSGSQFNFDDIGYFNDVRINDNNYFFLLFNYINRSDLKNLLIL